MDYVLDELSIASLRSIKTKQRSNASRLNKKVKKEIKHVDSEEKENGEKEDVPLKRKRQSKEEVSWSKKAKTSKAKDSKKTLLLYYQEVPTRRSSLIPSHPLNQNSPRSQSLKLPQNQKRQQLLEPPHNLKIQP